MFLSVLTPAQPYNGLTQPESPHNVRATYSAAREASNDLVSLLLVVRMAENSPPKSANTTPIPNAMYGTHDAFVQTEDDIVWAMQSLKR